MTPDPSEWYQKRPGGPWYRRGSSTAHYVKTCERCGEEYLGQGRAQFCSRACINWKADDIGYGAAHRRVKDARGRASEHPCIDGCGRQAEDWSYDHELGCPDEKIGEEGREAGRAYCPSHVECYQPRCRKCHRGVKDIETTARGERHYRAKLSAPDVREIRRLYSIGLCPEHPKHSRVCRQDGHWTQPKLADKFRVNRSQISRAIRGERWTHVEGETE